LARGANNDFREVPPERLSWDWSSNKKVVNMGFSHPTKMLVYPLVN
jgi:hypothetical protein